MRFIVTQIVTPEALGYPATHMRISLTRKVNIQSLGQRVEVLHRHRVGSGEFLRKSLINWTRMVASGGGQKKTLDQA